MAKSASGKKKIPAKKKVVKEETKPVAEKEEVVKEEITAEEIAEQIQSDDEFAELTIKEIMVQKGVSRERAIEILKNPST